MALLWFIFYCSLRNYVIWWLQYDSMTKLMEISLSRCLNVIQFSSYNDIEIENTFIELMYDISPDIPILPYHD